MIDLRRTRDLGAILNDVFRLYRGYFGVFAAITLAVVVPLDVLTLGLVDGYLTGGYGDQAYGGGVAYTIVQLLVTVPLVTGAHLSAVVRVSEGGQPRAGEALASASAVLPALIGTVLLYLLATLGGLVLLIIPGIIVAVRLYVSTQACVAEQRSPRAALARSWDLTRGNWWRVFGIVLVLTIISGVFGGLLGVPVRVAAAAIDSGPLLVLATIVIDTITISFVALGGTLLFFDLRARHDGVAAQGAAAVPPPPAPVAPERPR